mmetsp:Transcript_20713/g.57863  ORF Transcript_20713/g.57863 Transcript_20713/m.57863 type:complete len:204 (-) Transcript_20713:286-897(-)
MWAITRTDTSVCRGWLCATRRLQRHIVLSVLRPRMLKRPFPYAPGVCPPARLSRQRWRRFVGVVDAPTLGRFLVLTDALFPQRRHDAVLPQIRPARRQRRLPDLPRTLPPPRRFWRISSVRCPSGRQLLRIQGACLFWGSLRFPFLLRRGSFVLALWYDHLIIHLVLPLVLLRALPQHVGALTVETLVRRVDLKKRRRRRQNL